MPEHKKEQPGGGKDPHTCYRYVLSGSAVGAAPMALCCPAIGQVPFGFPVLRIHKGKEDDIMRTYIMSPAWKTGHNLSWLSVKQLTNIAFFVPHPVAALSDAGFWSRILQNI